MTPTTVLALVVAVGLAAATADQEQPAPQLIAYRGFDLLPGECPARSTGCRSQQPKAWAPSEVALVKRAIDEILESPDGALVVDAAHRRGVTALRRFSYGFRDSAPLPANIASFIRRPSSAHLELYDRFFAVGDSRDSLYPGTPGYLLVAQSLLHELFHVVDSHSSLPEFLKLAGFDGAGSRLRYGVTTPEEVTILNEWDRELPLLEAKGAFLEQRRLNRALAQRMPGQRLPTLDSIRGPAEAFAEIGSHIVLDRNAPKYLSAEMIQYFKDHVLRSYQVEERVRGLPNPAE